MRQDLRGGRPLAANIVYKATADVVSKAVTLAITVAAARVLSNADFGVLALGMTTGWLLGVASDAGLPLYLAKRMAQGAAAGAPEGFAPIAAVMRLRMVFALAAAGAGLVVGMVLVPREARLAFDLIVAAQLLGAALETLSHAYRGLGRTAIESTITLSQRLATVVAALAVLTTTPSLVWLATAMASPPAIALLVSLAIARRVGAPGHSSMTAARQDDVRFDSPWSFAPVGLGILVSALYFRCDVYFVEQWHGLEMVGTYNAAFRIVEALRLFPAAVLAVVFPILCRADDLQPLKRVTAALLASAAVLSALLYLTSAVTLDLVYGSRFAIAAPALRVLALTLPLFFVNYALTHQVIAWDGQRAYLGIAATALAANLIGNWLLIPAGGMTGAAVSTLVTELVVAGGCVLALSRGQGRLGQLRRITPVRDYGEAHHRGVP